MQGEISASAGAKDFTLGCMDAWRAVFTKGRLVDVRGAHSAAAALAPGGGTSAVVASPGALQTPKTAFLTHLHVCKRL